jgi:hypothetical protein
MRFLDQILPYAAILLLMAGATGAGSALARPSGEVFTPRKRHVEMTAQQLGRYANYGEVQFELRSADPAKPLTASSASIGYHSIDSRRGQWGWLDTQALSRSGNRISVRIPILEASHLASVDLSVMQEDAFVGTVRLIVSSADQPHVGALPVNGQPIELEGIDGDSFQIIPRLSDGMPWRLSGAFLRHRSGARTF